jgi:molecular chaperone GrpE (heat shock protein)
MEANMEPFSDALKAKIDITRDWILAVQDDISDLKSVVEGQIEDAKFAMQKELYEELLDDKDYLEECIETLERAENEISRL